MQTLLEVAALAFVVGLPGGAAVAGAWRRTGIGHPGEAVALAFSGLGISCVVLWGAAIPFGLGVETVVGATLVASALAYVGGRALQAGSSTPAGPAGEKRRQVAALVAVALLFVALVVVPFLPYGWHRGDGVHRMAMSDWYKHLVVTTELALTEEFPPPNPFLRVEPGGSSYYFGFHLVAAAVSRLAGGGGEVYGPLLSLTLLTAVAVPFVLFAIARPWLGAARAVLAAAGGTLLAGLDLVVLALDTLRNLVAGWPPTASLAGLRAVVPSTHLDYWIHHNERQFSAPYTATIWAPQHVAAALTAVLALGLVLGGGRRAGFRDRLLPALLLAAVPALSAYCGLAVGFGAVAAIALEAALRRSAPWRTDAFHRWVPTGAMAGVAAAPVALVLAGNAGTASDLVAHVSSAGGWVNGAVLSAVFGDAQWARLLDTPMVLLLELGVVGALGSVGAVLCWRAGREMSGRSGQDGEGGQGQARGPVAREAAIFAGAVVLLAVLVRPPVGQPNNLYARPLLMVWWVGAVFAVAGAAAIWNRGGRGLRALVLAATVACVAGTGYATLGAYLEGALFWAAPAGDVRALAALERRSRPADVVAIEPGVHQRGFAYFLRRRTVSGDPRHARLFGASAERVREVEASIEEAFAAADPGLAAERLDRLGASWALLRTERAAGWARPPCFRVEDEVAGWLLVRRRREACR